MIAHCRGRGIGPKEQQPTSPHADCWACECLDVAVHAALAAWQVGREGNLSQRLMRVNKGMYRLMKFCIVVIITHQYD